MVFNLNINKQASLTPSKAASSWLLFPSNSRCIKFCWFYYVKQEVFLFQVDDLNTNFRMPDGLGGGWHVKHHENDKVGVHGQLYVLYHHVSFRLLSL